MASRAIGGLWGSLRRGISYFFWRRCFSGLPWFWPASAPDQSPAMVEARRLVRQEYGREYGPTLRWLARLFTATIWPLAIAVSFFQARVVIRPEQKLLNLKRAPGAFWIAFRHNILPIEYYAYGLWQPERKLDIDSYLYTNECARVFSLLNRPCVPNPLTDKLALYEVCMSHGIRTPAVLAVFAPDGRSEDFRGGAPPKNNLFVKASTGASRAELFRWLDTLFVGDSGQCLQAGELKKYLSDRARTENLTLIVQPALENHPALELQPTDALASARLVTGRRVSGEVVPIFCILYFGQPNEITSHSDTVTLLNVETGHSMPPPSINAPGVTMYTYRDIGSGDLWKVPDWDEALENVKAAHRACRNFVFIGWDVAFTPNGPFILEGNTNWAPNAYQTLSGVPLGRTVFSDVLSDHLTKSKDDSIS